MQHKQISASFGKRLVALAIDCFASTLVAMLVASSPTPGLIAAVVFFFAYTFFVAFYGQTLGMRLMRIACVRYSASAGEASRTGEVENSSLQTNVPIGLWRAALRTILLQLVVPAVFLDDEGRGWHDRAAGSVMLATQA